MTVNLQRFCANDFDYREYLRAPWRAGNWVYATNGHVCVRVAAALVPDALQSSGQRPNAAALFDKWFDQEGEFLVMPEVPAAEVCKACDGHGWHHAIKCSDCTDGVFKHGHHAYDCLNCADEPVEAGYIATEDAADPKMVCNECIGRGFARLQFHELGCNKFDLGYLNWLAALPQLRVRVHEGLDAAAAFIFDGGQALLMPVRW